jgi:hypothetical protein
VLDILERRAAQGLKHVFFDTPGQIEVSNNRPYASFHELAESHGNVQQACFITDKHIGTLISFPKESRWSHGRFLAWTHNQPSTAFLTKPNQVFTWSASGMIITETLALKFPTVLLWVSIVCAPTVLLSVCCPSVLLLLALLFCCYEWWQQAVTILLCSTMVLWLCVCFFCFFLVFVNPSHPIMKTNHSWNKQTLLQVCGGHAPHDQPHHLHE